MGYEIITLFGAAISLILVALYRFLTRPYDIFERRGIPGPSAVAIFGTWWGLWNKQQGEEDLRRIKQYGPIYGEYAGRTPVLVAADPTVARAVLEDHTSHFRSRRANCLRDKFIQQGLLALEARNSKTTPDVPLLTKDNIKKVVPRISRCTADLSKTVKKAGEAADGKVIISGAVTDFIAKVIAEAVLGQDDSHQRAIDVKNFTTFVKVAYLNENPDSPLAAIPFIYPSLAPLDKFVLRSKAARFFTLSVLNRVQEKTNAEKPKQDRQPDLLDLLFEIQQAAKKKEPEEESKTEENIIQLKEFVFTQGLAVLLNTSLTTRTMTTRGVALLAAKPELQERLHSELYQKLETADEFELAQNSEYLDMFLAEVLRLYPLEYRLERECCEPLELEKVKVEKGMIVSIPVYALHRQSQLYDDPETFNPERFSRDNKEKRDSFAHLPYGQTGDSIANISTQWSVLVAKMAIAALIKDFKFLPAEDTKIPPTFESGLTGIPLEQPLTVIAESRK